MMDMPVGTMRNHLGRTHHQPAVPDSLRTDEAVCQYLHIPRPPSKDDNFKAAIVVQVDMQRGNDDGVAVVLQIGQLRRKKSRVMIVDKSYGTYHGLVRRNHGRTHQPVTNQIAERFGTVLIPFVLDE